jgi:hypothetical protein
MEEGIDRASIPVFEIDRRFVFARNDIHGVGSTLLRA